MKRIAEMLGVSKNERTGLYVILVAMAVAVGVMLLVRSVKKPAGSDATLESQVQQAEAMAESIEKARIDTLKAKSRKKRVKSDSVTKLQAAPQVVDRTLDELPHY